MKFKDEEIDIYEAVSSISHFIHNDKIDWDDKETVMHLLDSIKGQWNEMCYTREGRYD